MGFAPRIPCGTDRLVTGPTSGSGERRPMPGGARNSRVLVGRSRRGWPRFEIRWFASTARIASPWCWPTWARSIGEGGREPGSRHRTAARRARRQRGAYSLTNRRPDGIEATLATLVVGPLRSRLRSAADGSQPGPHRLVTSGGMYTSRCLDDLQYEREPGPGHEPMHGQADPGGACAGVGPALAGPGSTSP